MEAERRLPGQELTIERRYYLLATKLAFYILVEDNLFFLHEKNVHENSPYTKSNLYVR